MSIGVNLDFCLGEISLERQVELMKQNGFTKTFCMATYDDIDNIIDVVQKHGVEFEFLHAQLTDINDMWRTDSIGDNMLNVLCRNTDICSMHNIPLLVVHLSAGRPAPDVNDIGFKRYDKLMAYAREHNVKIAYENSRCVGNLAVALEKYDDAYFCWDAGHEICFTPGMDFMPYFGHKIGAVHIHDNMAVLDEDLHMIPFDGINDMQKVARELAKVGYNKSIMLELAKNEFGKYDNVTIEEFYIKASSAARRIEQMFFEYSKEL